MGKKVVYLLGAGASANALPVVSNLNFSLKMFIEHLIWFDATFNKSTNIGFLNKEIKDILNRVSTHYTIDTYAKKIYLKNPQVHTNKEYNLLLKILASFFSYEQFKILDQFDWNKPILGQKNNTKEKYAKYYKTVISDIDYRYDSFFASILKNDSNGNISIPEEIKIISWNYDLQVEKGFMNFSDQSLMETFQVFNTRGLFKGNHFVGQKSSFLTKLNGTAIFHNECESLNTFEKSEDILKESDLLEIVNRICESRNTANTALRFSWECNSEIDETIAYSNNIIRESDIIVIIGYSFPYFNRSVDKKLFNFPGINSKKIYIQATKEDINSIIYRFKGVCDNNPEPYTELDQFLIPNEL